MVDDLVARTTAGIRFDTKRIVYKQYEEKQLNESQERVLRVRVDASACLGFGNCVHEAPDLFALEPNGRAVVLQEAVPLTEQDAVDRAARRCPVRAIHVAETGLGAKG